MLLPALVLLASLVIGFVLFAVEWSVSGIRERVTSVLLLVPKWLLLLLVVGILFNAILFIRHSINHHNVDEEQEAAADGQDHVSPVGEVAEQMNAVSVPESFPEQPSSRLHVPSTPLVAPPHSNEPGVHVDAGTQNVLQPQYKRSDPETPIPPTLENMQQLLRHDLNHQTILGEREVPLVERRVPSSQEPILLITLLKEVTLTIRVPGGRGTRRVPIKPGTKRAQLLAYLAVRREELVNRDKILYHLFAWRREDGTADDEMLGNHFHSHTKLLRNTIKETVQQLNAQAGEQLLDPDIDPFSVENEHWGLSNVCQVVDIEAIEQHYKAIELASKDGLLAGDIPLFVKTACEQLIAAYSGDFIEDLVKKNPSDFKPWDGKPSWAKHYNTLFRGWFLRAKWILGEWEVQQALLCASTIEKIQQEGLDGGDIKKNVEQLLGSDLLSALERKAATGSIPRSELVVDQLGRQRRISYGRAIEPFRSYALRACSTPYYTGTPFDEKVSYNATTERFGDRVIASEQALRRCLKACAFTDNTREATDVYSAYESQMTSLFTKWGLEWEPSEETRQEWESVRSFTDAHRFSFQRATRQTG